VELNPGFKAIVGERRINGKANADNQYSRSRKFSIYFPTVIEGEDQ
jgi:hypothetical protein